MRYSKILLSLSITGFLILAVLMTAALAHKVLVSAWTEGPTVMVEGAFGDGSVAKNSSVTVYDTEGGVLVEGKTDEEGFFSFPVPVKADLKIVLDAGMGHVAETVIPADDISMVAGTEPAAQPAEATTVAEAAAVTKSQPAAAAPVQTAYPQLSKQDVQLIVDKGLKKQLRPVMEQLSARKFTDILAGIGYILGLVGIGSYFNYRRKSQNLT